eukprot:TRINITY_DN2347_c0_g1_i1.p1 TRINITY_DN2347_c0_g1~~TRINITY_DN2347_c0_g1_i1.p1  ORF type:complete len:962 (+),score=247.74 TRINITY_DN2347_c0_g1_i1:25-2886(+)
MAIPAFGAPILDLYKDELIASPGLKVPHIIEKSIGFLMETGLNAEGLFRVPGSTLVVNFYKDMFNSGKAIEVDFMEEGKEDSLTPENIASLLKLYLRELPEPLFTNEKENAFSALMEDEEDEEERIDKYRELISSLPSVNQETVKKLLNFLMQVSANSSTNMMHADNLSIVFGEMAGVFARHGKLIVTWLIEKYTVIYEKPDLEAALNPTFQRKLMGHLRSVLGLFQDGDYVWSFDGMGMVRVWKRTDMQFYKNFSTKMQLIAPPFVFNDNLYCFAPGMIKFCPTETILDPDVSNPLTSFEDIESPPGSLLVVGIAVGDEIWAAGDRLVTISTDHVISELNEPHPQHIIKTLAHIGDNVWVIKGKSLQVYNIETKELVHESTAKTFGDIAKICEIGERVWLVGNKGPSGKIWVIDPEDYSIYKEITRHKGAIYTAAQIGSLAWTVAWDCKINVWDAETLEYIRPLPNLHRDAIREILSVYKEEMDGWQVWTGSSDRTINITFVPTKYAEHCLPETPEEVAKREALEEEILRKEQEKNQAELELMKRKKEERAAKKRAQVDEVKATSSNGKRSPRGSPKGKKKGKEKKEKVKKKEKEKEKVEFAKRSFKMKKHSHSLIKSSSSKATQDVEKNCQREIENLMKATKKLSLQENIEEIAMDNLKSLWDACDVDGSGALDSEEQMALFHAMWEYYNKKSKKKEKDRTISLWSEFFDTDKDQLLSWDEFLSAVNLLRVANTEETITVAIKIQELLTPPATELFSDASDLSERELVILEILQSEAECASGLAIFEELYKGHIEAEMHKTKKLSKHIKELNVLSPLLRLKSVHVGITQALVAKLNEGSVEVGNIIRDAAFALEPYSEVDVVSFHAQSLPKFFELVNSKEALKKIYLELEALLAGVSGHLLAFFISLTLHRLDKTLTRVESLRSLTPGDHPDVSALDEAISVLKGFLSRWQ